MTMGLSTREQGGPDVTGATILVMEARLAVVKGSDQARWCDLQTTFMFLEQPTMDQALQTKCLQLAYNNNIACTVCMVLTSRVAESCIALEGNKT